jgi:luciferase family oxidoreductase group 1
MPSLASVPLSFLDLASIRFGQSAREALQRSGETVQHAERLGYTRYWVAEHHNSDGIASSAPAVLISHLATVTSSIRVGSGGVMLPNHAPLVVAEQFGTLDSLFPGRIDLGLGRAPGTDPQTARALRRNNHQTGEDFPRLLHELQSFLSTDPFQTIKAYPGAGLDIAIWILGSSTYSAQLAAEEGLPFAFASHFAPDDLFEALDLYRERFRPSAQLEKPYAMVTLPVVIADTDAEAERLFSTTYQRFLALTRGKSMVLRPPVEDMDLLWNEAERDMIRSRFVLACVGSRKTVREKMERVLDATRADELMITCDTFDNAARLQTMEALIELRLSMVA